MFKILVSIFVLTIVFSLSACNTVQGVGKDLEKAGEAVQKSTK